MKSPRKKTCCFIAALALVAAFTGCMMQKTKPIIVDLVYIPPEQAAEAGEAPAKDVVVHLAPVVDARSNRESIGQTTVSVLPGSDVLLWVQDGLLTLGDRGCDLNLSGSDPVEGYRLVVTVDRVYCRSASATLRSTIVLSVEYYEGGQLLGKRVHRGEAVVQDSSPFEGTYAFNEGRVLEVLNGGLGDAVEQIHAVIDEMEGM